MRLFSLKSGRCDERSINEAKKKGKMQRRNKVKSRVWVESPTVNVLSLNEVGLNWRNGHPCSEERLSTLLCNWHKGFADSLGMPFLFQGSSINIRSIKFNFNIVKQNDNYLQNHYQKPEGKQGIFKYQS